MSKNLMDVVMYTHLFKDNYRKGIHNLRSMLCDADTAAALSVNPAGLAVIFSAPVDKPDRNSQELKEILMNSDIQFTAFRTYYAGIAGTCNSWADLAASSALMAAVIADSTAIGAVAASSAAMTAVVASAVAMGAVASSAVAMDAVVASAVAMDAVINTPSALAEVVASSTAMAAVAASSTVMAAVAENKAAITEIEASSTAKTALYNSPLKTSMSSVGNEGAWTNRRSGKVWLISFKQTFSGSSNYTMKHRYTLRDNTTISCTASQSYNIDYRIDRFMDSITNFSSVGGIGECCTYYFIPC